MATSLLWLLWLLLIPVALLVAGWYLYRRRSARKAALDARISEGETYSYHPDAKYRLNQLQLEGRYSTWGPPKKASIPGGDDGELDEGWRSNKPNPRPDIVLPAGFE